MEPMTQFCPLHGEMILASSTTFQDRTIQHWVCKKEGCPTEDVYIDLENPDEEIKTPDNT